MADYYVATDGDDSGDGTENNPLATVHEAVDRVSEGDTIHVGGGTYQHRNGNPIVIGGVSGSSSNPITITSPAGERPHLRWQGGSTQWDMQGGIDMKDGASHWVIEGLEISHSPALGIHAKGGVENTYRDLHLHSNGNSGIQAQGDNCVLSGVESYNNYDEAENGEDADGIVVAHADGGLIKNCACYNNSDDGIDLWASANITVRNTACYNNGRDSAGDGNGFKSSNVDTGGNNKFIRCVSYGNRNHGFRNYSVNADLVANCTSYNDGSHSFAAINGGDHAIVNCASYETPNVNSFHSGVSDHDNTWNLGISNPQFVSTDSSTDGFLVPAADSPLVNAGAVLSAVEYSGEAPDIGTYEYAETSTSDGTQASSEWSLAGIYYHDGTGFVETSVKSQ